MSFAKYEFLPWTRRGLSAYISELDTLGKSNGTVVERATVKLSVEINKDPNLGDSINFQMIGPGDIVGIKSEMIIRTEPLDTISGFEPNYLPYVEFYDEDFPWRYTPAKQVDTIGPDSIKEGRLRPWLALVVLKADEFENSKRRQPLTSITVTKPGALPPHDELHLWAHAHNNKPVVVGPLENFIDKLEEDYKTDPDGLYSRILCPRHLEADTLYHAFLVPSYETGRLAGLGQVPKNIPAQKPSWDSNTAKIELPVYHRWLFRTGENFDFESLVKLLEPRVMDDKVGTRPMDTSRPGYVKADGVGEVTGTDPSVIFLEGALLAPQTKPNPENWDTTQDFVLQLTELVKLNKYNEEHQDEDPTVTVPFYGMYHAMEVLNTLPDFDPETVSLNGKDATKWQNELNRDPRWRVAAGFGTRMVQEDQERLMDSAWKQLNKVLALNKKIQGVQLTAKVLKKSHEKHFLPLADEKMLSMTRSLSARVPVEVGAVARSTFNPENEDSPFLTRVTVKSTINDGALPAATLTHPFRRALRNQSKMLRLLEKSAVFIFDATQEGSIAQQVVVSDGLTRNFGGSILKNVVDGLNQNWISAAPETKFDAITDLTNAVLTVPAAETIKVWSVKSNTDEDFIYNLPDSTGGLPDVDKWSFIFGPQINTLGTLDNIDKNNIFLGGETDFSDIFKIQIIKSAAPPSRDADPDLNVFSTAFEQMNIRRTFATPVIPKPPVPINSVSGTIKQFVQPVSAFKRMLSKSILIGGQDNQITEDFLPAMAYPDFNEPTYEYLVKIDKELLLPNLNLIPPNTISLLRTNQKFIESYLVGLNYEMGRELLWREYPTDMRGSYFRQFWDVRGIVTPNALSLDAEGAKDIKPIHTWINKNDASTWPLGKHNARDMQKDASQLVFVVRGNLLEKFPNTVIYAQKGVPDRDYTKEVGTAGNGKKIYKLLSKTDEDGNDKLIPVIRRNFEEFDANYEKEVMFPSYKAEIGPDIKLFGFDLTIEQAAGLEDSSKFENETWEGAPSIMERLGWFFVIAEVPGEPRFGMDLKFDPNEPNNPANYTWNDLSWENFKESDKPLDFIRENISPSFVNVNLNSNEKGTWGRSSADMATILFQRPVMVATHAREMLDEEILDENKKLNEASSETTLMTHTRSFVQKNV